jgi:hypothetical protein
MRCQVGEYCDSREEKKVKEGGARTDCHLENKIGV